MCSCSKVRNGRGVVGGRVVVMLGWCSMDNYGSGWFFICVGCRVLMMVGIVVGCPVW